MKRFLNGLLALVGVALLTAPAFAGGVFTTEALQWRFPNGQTYSVTGTYQQAKKYLVASANDTTTWVSTEGWFVPEQTATGADSVLVARFIIQVDSTSYTPPGVNKTMTVTVNGSAVDNDSATHDVLSTTIYPTDGAKFVVVPIWIKHGASVFNLPAKQAWVGLPPLMRLIVQGNLATGAARVYIQHLKPAK
jgi:hypothetical protein